MNTDITNSILEIDAPVIKDESIEKYSFHEYPPVTGNTNLGEGADIRMVIETQDLFIHTSKSKILIEGQVVKADGDKTLEKAEVDNKLAFINNGVMYLFRFISYLLSGQEIERINHPGQATTMLGLLKYGDDFDDSRGLNQGWYRDDAEDEENNGFEKRNEHIFEKEEIEGSDPKETIGTPGKFCFVVPLSHIFGFAEDYDKVIFGFKHELVLCRASEDKTLFVKKNGENFPDLKINLTKVSWIVPHVLPADLPKMKLYKKIESKISYEVAFRRRQADRFSVPPATSFSWRLSIHSSPEKPRWIILGFQGSKMVGENKILNKSQFNHLNIKDIFVHVNDRVYPPKSYNFDFKNGRYGLALDDLLNFKTNYYGIDENVCNSSGIDPISFKNLYPLFIFDVSKQSERMKSSITDILVEGEFEAAPSVDASPILYALVLSDKIMKFQSDGNKLNVIRS